MNGASSRKTGRRSARGFGAGLALAALILIAAVFWLGLSGHGGVVILAILAAVALAWINRHKALPCPVCRDGILQPENIGTVQQKLGIVDHPFLRAHRWTQWYRCSQCGHREWDEHPDHA